MLFRLPEAARTSTLQRFRAGIAPWALPPATRGRRAARLRARASTDRPRRTPDAASVSQRSSTRRAPANLTELVPADDGYSTDAAGTLQRVTIPSCARGVRWRPAATDNDLSTPNESTAVMLSPLLVERAMFERVPETTRIARTAYSQAGWASGLLQRAGACHRRRFIGNQLPVWRHRAAARSRSHGDLAKQHRDDLIRDHPVLLGLTRHDEGE